MRYLLISLLVLVLACGSYPKRNNFKATAKPRAKLVNPYFSDSTTDYVYKADISLFKHNFSGIFIVKKLGDDAHRIAFTTEMGNKIFDFSFLEEDFKVNYILADMDKKMILNVLKNDFKALISENPLCTSVFEKNEELLLECEIYGSKHYYHTLGEHFFKMVKAKNGSEKVTFLFSEVEGKKADRIKITHQNIDLTIILKAI